MLGHWPGAALEKHSIGVNVAMDPKASEGADLQLNVLLTKESLLKEELSSPFSWSPYPQITFVSELKKVKNR